MASKILVKLPTVPFSQGKKQHTELVAVANRNEPVVHHKQTNGSGDRAAHLEQNMKFLQEQHQAILVALQKEVETLRQRNRDLQFQLVFSNGTTNQPTPSSPLSPEDNGNGFVKSKGSPICVNVASLQVEILERDLQDLKVSLNEAKSQNHYLIGIIDQQKKKLDSLERRAEKPPEAEIGIQVGNDIQAIQTDLGTRLEDAEAMVLCLRRENEDQRREISAIKATANKGNGNSSGRNHGSNGHRSRGQGGGNGGQEQNSHRFPPLHNQSYWHHGSRENNSFVHGAEFRGRARQDKQGQDSANGGGTVLPQLRSGPNKAESFSYPSFLHRQRGYHNNSNYYSEGYRKYRGQRSQRDFKERESREPRESREFREQNRDPKDQYKAKTSKEP